MFWNCLRENLQRLLFLAVVLLTLSASSADGQATEAVSLAPNQTLEREMTGAETHLFKFDLKKDEFFQVRVEQKGVDVALNLRNEDGASLATMDSPNSKEGPETLSFVADKPGGFILEVSGFDPKAEKGTYTIFRGLSRIAAEKDKRRVAVERSFVEEIAAVGKLTSIAQLDSLVLKLTEVLNGWKELNDNYLTELTAQSINQLKKTKADVIFNEAVVLFNQKTAESYGAALDKFQTASRIYEEISDTSRNAETSLFLSGSISDNLGKKSDALKFYNKVLLLFRASGNKDDEAATLTNIGLVYDSLGEKQKALDYYNQSLPLFKAVPNKNGEATTLNNIGLVYDSLDEKQKALDYYNQALPILKAVANKSVEAITLNNIGKVYDSLGEKQKALDYYNQALPMSVAVGNKDGEAITLNNIGKVYDSLGEKQKALDYFNQALSLFKAVGRKSGEATTLNNIGLVYDSLGEKQKALDYYNQALPILKAVANKSVEATTLINIGAVYDSLGEKQKALDFYNQALPLKKIVGDKRGEATTFTNIGKVYDDLGEKQKALDYYNQALPIFKAISDKSGEATTFTNIGKVYGSLGEKQKALDCFNQALPLRKIGGDKSGEATTLINIGAVYNSLGENQKALDYFNQALLLKKVVGDKSGEATTLNNMMIVWEALQNPRIAAFYGKQAVNKYQELRQNIKGLDKETQKTYLKSVEFVYRELADLLIAQGSFAQAEQILAMLKEDEYFDFVRRDAGEVGKLDERVPLNETEKTLIAKYALLADKITEIGQEFIKLDDKKRQLSRSDLQLSAAEQAHYAELEKQLDTANAAFQLFLSKELVAEIGKEKTNEIEVDRSLQDKLRKWGDGTVALYTVAGADRYRVVLTTAKVQVDGKTEIKIAELNKKVFAFRAALQNPKIDPRPLGKELYDILIKPVEKELKAANAKTLVWSLDGTLRYIPLAALSPDGVRYLVEDVQNVIITPKTRDDLTDSDANWEALGLGVSEAETVANPDDQTRSIPFDPLPGTERELSAIVKDEKSANETGVLPGRRFMNRDFTATALKDSLIRESEDGQRKYNLIHIASHFRLGSSDANSFLLLGGGQILTLADIRNSSTIDFGNVDLITLSACNTGFAGDTNGREIDSLASVIQTKSGKAVLATLWSVADESTSLLMSEFYRLRKENPKLTKAEAIQAAQKEMLEGKLQAPTEGGKKGTEIVDNADSKLNAPPFQTDKNKPFAHPYYWSPFILIGNWR